MDIRIVTFILLLGVVGSFADVGLPYVRMRRNGLQEMDIPSLVMELDGIPRTKRESVDSSTIESTATPKSTADPTTASTRSTSSAKPDSTGSSSSKPNPTNDPTTRPTSPAPKPSPRSRSPSKSTSPKPVTSPAPTETTTKSKKPMNSRKPTNPGKPTDPGTTTPSLLASRIDSSQEEPQESAKKPDSMSVVKPEPSRENFANPAFQNSPFPYFMPNFIPDFSPLRIPYGDSTFNSIPGPSNYAQTGTSNGGGSASSFASASAGGFGSSGYDAQPSLGIRGAFVDNTPNVANVPDTSYTPSVVSSGGFGFGGGDIPFVDPYQFNQYNLEQFQRQMNELQMQFQRQQQELNERFNRIYSDPSYPGGAPGGHSAISSINLGPGGGYQSGAINPASPGIESRFGEELPPPSGNNYAVFSSSSSKTMRGPDGKLISHKTSSTGVNDNGKITFRTIED